MSILGDLTAALNLTADDETSNRVVRQLSDPTSALSLMLDLSSDRSASLTGWPSVYGEAEGKRQAIDAEWAAMSRSYRGWRLAWRWFPLIVCHIAFGIALPLSIVALVQEESGSLVAGVLTGLLAFALLGSLAIGRWQRKRVPWGTVVECVIGMLWMCGVWVLARWAVAYVFAPSIDGEMSLCEYLCAGYLGGVLGGDYGFGFRERLILGGMTVRTFVTTIVVMPITLLPWGAIAFVVILGIFNYGPAAAVARLVLVMSCFVTLVEALSGRDIPTATIRHLIVSAILGLIQGVTFGGLLSGAIWLGQGPDRPFGNPWWWFGGGVALCTSLTVSSCFTNGFHTCIREFRKEVGVIVSYACANIAALVLLEGMEVAIERFVPQRVVDLLTPRGDWRANFYLAVIFVMMPILTWMVYRAIIPRVASRLGITRLLDRMSGQMPLVSPTSQTKSRLERIFLGPLIAVVHFAGEFWYSLREMTWELVAPRRQTSGQ